MFAARVPSCHRWGSKIKDYEAMMNYSIDVVGAAATGILIIGTSMIDVSDPVVVTAGAAMLATLSGAVKVLWDKNNTLSKSTDVALTKCEEEHKKTAANMEVLVQQVISLSGEVGLMKGRIIGFQEATERGVADRALIRDELQRKLDDPIKHLTH